MPDATNGLSQAESSSQGISWKLGPRDFVFKNLKYIPWIIICAAHCIGIGLAEIRYSTPIYMVQSSMLINNQG